MEANFSGGVDYTDGNVMSYDTEGQFCVAGKPGAPVADIVPIGSPGVYNNGTKNYAGGLQEITIKCTYITGSEAQCESAANGDAVLLGKTVNDLTLGGVPYPACKLLKFDQDQPRFTGRNGNWRMDVNVSVLCMRPFPVS